MKLHKPVYGLVDATRSWYREARERLEKMDFRVHLLDSCLFSLYDSNSLDDKQRPGLICLLGLYVDDIIAAGSSQDSSYVDAIAKLQGIFAFREWHEDKPQMEYLGSQVDRAPDGTLKY